MSGNALPCPVATIAVIGLVWVMTERCKWARQAREAVLPARGIAIAVNSNCPGDGQLAGCFPLVLRVKAQGIQLDPHLIDVPELLAKIGGAATDAVHELGHRIDA